MKRCPTCNEIFEEGWLSFCTLDGTTLIDDRGSSGEPLPMPKGEPAARRASAHEQATLHLPSSGSGGFDAQFPEPQPIQPAWQPPPPPSYAVPPNKSLATASIVLGIVSLICAGPLPGIVAIVLGGMALSQMKKNPERIGGQQMAVTGIVTGSLSIVVYVGFMIVYILIVIASANQ